MDVKTHWSGEVQLMGFGESDSSGAWIKFQVQPEDLDHFRGLKGNVFDMLLANMEQTIGDITKKGGQMSKEAAKICKTPHFQAFASRYYKHKYDQEAPVTEEIAVSMIYERCHVTTRKDLDHDDLAKKRFIMVMSKYRNWMREQNVV